MKSFGIAIGLAALLAASSAKATIVYDTITGVPSGSNPVKITTAVDNLAPMGNHFKATNGEEINAVTVQLFAACSTACSGSLTDSGSVLVYLVPGVSGLPGTVGSPPSLNKLTLLNPIYVGTILDTSVVLGSPTNITVAPSTPIVLSQGNWWLVLTSGADANNFYRTVNPVQSAAKWETQSSALAIADGAFGIPPLQANAVIANAANGFVQYNAPPVDGISPPQIFMMQIDAPEPASLAILGAGLVGLGLSRRRRAAKSST